MNAFLNAGVVGAITLIAVSGCSATQHEAAPAVAAHASGIVYTVKDTTIQAAFEASGTADAIRQATLSTKLMGTVLDVTVKEGDVVAAGQALVRIDARDLSAKADQVAAAIAEAEAMQHEALTQAGRIRALYVDSAATRAQLDAAETGLARAEAGVRTARAAAAEIAATSTYSVIRSPFAGVITKRFVDPGAFAAPGTPLVSVQDGSQLRVSVNATPDLARDIRRGQRLDAAIEERPVVAIVEGVIPVSAGNLYTINAIVDNSMRSSLPGSTATIRLPLGQKSTLAVPATAVIRQGDLTGVTIRTADGDATRWVRLGRSVGSMVEVNAGLRAGDQIVLPPIGSATIAARN
jgi:RND family efflux transporter MFP subunit